METYSVRYGSCINLRVESEDNTAETVTLYVGHPGQTPVITIPASFDNGIAYINSDEEDTRVPLGTYKYQLNVTYTDGRTLMYPTDDDCDDADNPTELPDFKILESLSETEIVS